MEHALDPLENDSILLNCVYGDNSTQLSRTFRSTLSKHISSLRSELLLVYCGIRSAFLYEYGFLNRSESLIILKPFGDRLCCVWLGDLVCFVNSELLKKKLEETNEVTASTVELVSVSGSQESPLLLQNEQKLHAIGAIKATLRQCLVAPLDVSPHFLGCVGFLLDFSCIYVCDGSSNCLAMVPLDVIEVRFKFGHLKCCSRFSFSIPSSFNLAATLQTLLHSKYSAINTHLPEKVQYSLHITASQRTLPVVAL